MTIPYLDAGTTDLGRELHARSDAEGVLLGDWSIQIGTYGFDPLDPTMVLPTDYTLQALVSPLGTKIPLGLVDSSGTGVAATVGSDGHVTLTGLTGMTPSIINKWIRISSGSPEANGTWIVSSYIDATSVTIYNPLLTVDEAGPLDWELRLSCILKPNDRAASYYARFPDPDPATDGNDIGEVGLFARVIASPTDPSILGNEVLYAVAHHPAVHKSANMALSYHVVVQS